MRIRAELALLVAVVLVALVSASACTSSKRAGSPATSASRSSAAPTTAPKTAPAPAGGCGSGARAGSGGVVQVFCDGTATVRVTLGSSAHTLHGGTCAVSEGQLAVNVGAIVGVDYPVEKAKPDFVGILVEPRSSTVDAFTVFVGGDGGVVQGAKATLSDGDRHLVLTGTVTPLGDVRAEVVC